MLLIDRRGQRVRPVCQECRKVVGAKHRCPKRRLVTDPAEKAAERFARFVDIYNDSMRQRA